MQIPTPLGPWLIDPVAIAAIAVAAALYAIGVRYSRQAGIGKAPRIWRLIAFAAGLFTLLVALVSPVATAGTRMFWMHMIQSQLLILVAAPLLLLGAPLTPLWLAFPRSSRSTALAWVIKRTWPRQVWRQLSRFLFSPRAAWVLLVATFSLWHVPPVYELALAHAPIHAIQHVMFVGTALLFWAQVIPSPPLRPRMGYVMRAVYLVAFGMYSSLMGGLLMYSTTASYATYIGLESRRGSAISPLVDQHYAGAALDIPGTFILCVSVILLLWLWMREDERASDTAPARVANRV